MADIIHTRSAADVAAAFRKEGGSSGASWFWRVAEALIVLLEDVAKREARTDATEQALRDEIRQLRSGLQGITTRCETFTTGIGSCFRNSKTPHAEYSADACCYPCVVDHVLKCEKVG